MLTVLLIDNDEDELNLFYAAFHRLAKSPNCVHAASAGNGLQILQNFKPGYIYVDIDLNDISGLECTRQIQKIKKFQETPIIIYSDIISEGQWGMAKAVGATSYLNKTGAASTLAENILFFY